MILNFGKNGLRLSPTMQENRIIVWAIKLLERRDDVLRLIKISPRETRFLFAY